MPSAKKTTKPPRKSGEDSDPLERFNFQRDSLGYSLRRAQVRAYDLFFEMLGSLELSPARLTALSIIAMEPAITQAELARRLDVAGPSVVKMIDLLEAAGFIRRDNVEGDRRRYSLMLTPAGQRIMDTLGERLAAYEARLASRLSSAQRSQLITLLGRLASE